MQFVLNLRREPRVIDLNLSVRAGLHFPLVFVVKVDCPRLAQSLSLPVLLGDSFFLNPRLEADMEFPATLLELKGSEILLISSLHEVESKEQTFNIKPLEVVLPVIHRRSWEVSLGSKNLFLRWITVNCFING